MLYYVFIFTAKPGKQGLRMTCNFSETKTLSWERRKHRVCDAFNLPLKQLQLILELGKLNILLNSELDCSLCKPYELTGTCYICGGPP